MGTGQIHKKLNLSKRAESFLGNLGFKSKKHKVRTLLVRAKLVLKKKGYTDDCYPMDDLIGIIEDNHTKTMRKVFFYKWTAVFLLVVIPLLSASLSFAVNRDVAQVFKGDLSPYVPEMSLLLTVFTILNSILKPGERFKQACFIGIKIDHFKSDFIAELEKKSTIDDAILIDYVHSKRTRFECYQEQLIAMFLPEKP